MKIGLDNYRRFAGSSMTIETESDLVVICGPNASGKTSLVEAVGLAVHGETPDGADARRGRLISHLSTPGSDVRAHVECGGQTFTLTRRYEGDTLKRSPFNPVNPGLPIRATTDKIVGLGVESKRALGELAGVLQGGKDVAAQLEEARSREKSLRSSLRAAEQRLDGAMQVAGMSTVPTGEEIDQLRARLDRLVERRNDHRLWQSKVDDLQRQIDAPSCATPCASSWKWISPKAPDVLVNLRGGCPHARVSTPVDVDGLRDRLAQLMAPPAPQPPGDQIIDDARVALRTAEEQAKVGPAIETMRARVKTLGSQLKTATVEREHMESMQAKAASALSQWWSRFPVAVDISEYGDVSILHDGNVTPAIGLSGAMGQWLSQIAIPSLVLQSWRKPRRILAADVDRLAEDQLALAMRTIKKLYEDGYIVGAVLATCHACPLVDGWSVVTL